MASALNPDFLNASMGSIWYKDFIRIYVAGGCGAIGNLNKADLDNQKILIPKDKEQSQIGQFFSALDELIGAKEEELEKLRQLKAALLEQMFPSSESDNPNRGGYNYLNNNYLDKFDMVISSAPNTPRIRFKGFSGPWEKKTMVETFDFSVKHFNHSRDKLSSKQEQVATIHYGDILVKYGDIVIVGKDNIPFIISSRMEEYKTAVLKDGDVIFADTAEDETSGKAVEIINIKNNCIVSGLHTIVARPKIKFAQCYCGYYFNTNTYHNQLVPLMQGIKVLSINKTSLEPTVIYYPKEFAEQQRIGEFFLKQDEAIHASADNINKLKTIKQALLEKMFAA